MINIPVFYLIKLQLTTRRERERERGNRVVVFKSFKDR